MVFQYKDGPLPLMSEKNFLGLGLHSLTTYSAGVGYLP